MQATIRSGLSKAAPNAWLSEWPSSPHSWIRTVISHDNVSMKVDAVLYFNVTDPERAIIQVQSYLPATDMLAQTTLRAVLGQHELDEMLSERKKLSADVQSILDAQTETWAIRLATSRSGQWS
jgi:regulator of protease activity HflC (stomatin/prohibitin superfamily)